MARPHLDICALPMLFLRSYRLCSLFKLACTNFSCQKCMLKTGDQKQKRLKNNFYIGPKIVLISCDYYRRGSLDFVSVAPALLFGLLVCWPLNPAVCGTERSMRLCQHRDKVETLLLMPIPSPGYWLQDSDNEKVGWRSGRRMGWREPREWIERERERMGGLGKAVCFGAFRPRRYLMKMKWRVKNQ